MWRLLLLLSFPLSLVNAYCARDSQCRANYFCDSGKLRCISKKRSGEHCSLIDGDHECLSGHCTLTGFFEAKCVACTTDNHCKPDRFCQRNACQPRGNIGDVCNLALGGRDCRSRKCGIPLSLCVDCFSDDDCASNQYCFFTVPAVCRYEIGLIRDHHFNVVFFTVRRPTLSTLLPVHLQV